MNIRLYQLELEGVFLSLQLIIMKDMLYANVSPEGKLSMRHLNMSLKTKYVRSPDPGRPAAHQDHLRGRAVSGPRGLHRDARQVSE